VSAQKMNYKVTTNGDHIISAFIYHYYNVLFLLIVNK